MTEDRFKALAQAYGARLSRWPAAEQAAAAGFLADRPDAARAVLAEAARMDRALDDYAAGEASARLRTRIIEAAPRERRAGRLWRLAAGAALGLGLAASCAAGVAAGFTLAPPSVTRVIGGQTQAAEDNDINALADPAGDAADS